MAMQNKIISASIIGANFLELGRALQECAAAGVDSIHFDMMDGHYVPSLSIGPDVCKALVAGGTLPVEAHLMVANPDRYIKDMAAAGVKCLTVHPETCVDVAQTITMIREHGMEAGLAFNPDKNFVLAEQFLEEINLILLMSVFPGYCGQKFIPETMDKIMACRKMLDANSASHIKLGVDGGIKAHYIASVAAAGADFFVMGSGLFAAADMTKLMKEIRSVGI